MAPAVGPRIRALREAMGLSLRDLAERSGVSAPMLSQVERQETSPTIAVAAKIAAGLELTLSQLLRLDEGEHVAGSRETAVVLSGTLALVVDGSRHELRDGDSVTFDADLSHHFENEGDEPTRFLAVIAAGLRRS
jgi:transcriptional regulator with XRE-family HTH domain